MVNGLGVLGWGVGGIEAEAAMLGQPVSMLIPQVVGFKLSGQLPEGSTATDLVLTVTQMLRERGVVGKFVEFYGPGLAEPAARRPRHDRQHGAGDTARPAASSRSTRRRSATSSSRGARRSASSWSRPTARSRACSTTRTRPRRATRTASSWTWATSSRRWRGRAGRRTASALSDAATDFVAELHEYTGNEEVLTGYDEAAAETFPASDPVTNNGGGTPKEPGHSHPEPGTALAEREEGFGHGSVVIAAITSCTNTSNPSVMLGAGLLAKKAVEAGLERMPWVKTSLAPGSKVVTDYLERAELIEPLSTLGFDLVGYGCTTCIGNSGPLPEEISQEIEERDLVVASVLSGNRNFEGRIHPEVKMNYLASPPLCVAYALAGRMDLDIVNEPLRATPTCATSGPRSRRSTRRSSRRSSRTCSARATARSSRATRTGTASTSPRATATPGTTSPPTSSSPPYFEGMPAEAPEGFDEIKGARAIALLGDSVTTDHISPAGAIKKDSPAGAYLIENGVEPREFNSYGSRRGNHEVMIRGTFANIRLRNLLAGGAGKGFRGRLDGPRGRAGDDLRRRRRVLRGGDAALRARRQGVRLRLVTRLGRQGPAAARASAS